MATDRVERRAYFRIHDEIGLSYAVIAEDEDAPAVAENEMEMSLASILASVDHDVNETLNALWRENNTAAQAIGLLNQKISLLAAQLLQDDDSDAAGYEELTASISGCGMAFECAAPQPADPRLRVSVTLRPSNTWVRFTARVVACERIAEVPSARYLLRISIDEECVEARERLVQHVVQRQFDKRDIPGSAHSS